ncbi:hypothetical protein BDA99DRAFT_557879 [Phascolomyces articulosus]|uniref:Uncharacterized protein n=1 Tax=Phascolomyces articulosus TaxID=60185 RepID=A0AAD5K4R3_9FUNG|nr:hypothetical protein BDA99DRAFT_557879 [Phascolomyces articulosus]
MAVIRQQRVGMLFCATLTCFFLVATSFYAWSSHLKNTPKIKNQRQPQSSIPLIEYLDAAQLADSVSPLWSQSWYSVHRNNRKELENQRKLNEIIKLADTIELDESQQSSVTAIVLCNPQVQQQVDAIQSQSVAPDFVWIVCETEDDPIVQQQRQQQESVRKNTEIWIGDVRRIRSSTEYVWIVDKDTLPGQRYLELLMKLAHTNTYREILLGHRGARLTSITNDNDNTHDQHVSCESVVEYQPVDIVNDAWLLRSEWLSALSPYVNDDAPLGYWISRNLKAVVGIQSVTLPEDNDNNYPDYTITINHELVDICPSINEYLSKAEGHRANNKNEEEETLGFENDVVVQKPSATTATDKEEGDVTEHQSGSGAIMFLMDEEVHLDMAWMELICEMHKRADNNAVVHLATTGRGNLHINDIVTLISTYNSKCAASLPRDHIHSLQIMETQSNQLVPRLTRLVMAAEIQVVIHVQQESLDSIQTMKHMLPDVTIIGLPHHDLNHVTWMSELPVTTLQQWHDFTVKMVLTTESNDAPPFERLLRSVQNAGFLGDTVDITIFMECTSHVKTQQLAETLFWPHGEKDLRHRIVPTSRSWMFAESWYPSSDNEYAVILDDGIEVSPLFYIWTKYSILKYRYNPTPKKNLFGVSLYSPRIIDSSEEQRELFEPPSGYTPYLMQAPCSLGGGAVYFPEHWREFHDFMTARIADQDSHQLQTIQVPGARSRHWKYSWRRYLDELVYLRGNVMLYPNFEDNASFSTRHQLPEHATKHQAQDNLDLPGAARAVAGLFTVPLLKDTFALPDRQLPDWGDLPVLDLFGKPATLDILAERGKELQQQVSSCLHSHENDYDPSDLLCAFAHVVVEEKEEGDKKKKKKQQKQQEEKKQSELPTKLVTLYLPTNTNVAEATSI